MNQHPATHLPLPSNSIVRPLKAMCAVMPFSIFVSAAARAAGRSFPPSVTASLGWVKMTEVGRISSFNA